MKAGLGPAPISRPGGSYLFALLGLSTVIATVTAAVVAERSPFDHMRLGARGLFVVSLPRGCAIDDGGVKEDFQVFYVNCGGVDYAGIYAGNAPNPDVPRSRVLATGAEWPTHLQVWSDQVLGDQAKADAIAASVALRRTP